MVHSFEVVICKNGNAEVHFKEGSKTRRILFTKNTDALRAFSKAHDEHVCIKDAIQVMRSEYLFKANENNKSIFRPIKKNLTLGKDLTLPKQSPEVYSKDVRLVRAGCRRGEYNKFYVDAVITRERAAELQQELGYHPAGYGIYAFNNNGGKTYWECSNSCD